MFVSHWLHRSHLRSSIGLMLFLNSFVSAHRVELFFTTLHIFFAESEAFFLTRAKCVVHPIAETSVLSRKQDQSTVKPSSIFSQLVVSNLSSLLSNVVCRSCFMTLISKRKDLVLSPYRAAGLSIMSSFRRKSCWQGI